MMNFNFQNLYLVNPCNLDNECYARSVHANKIIDNSRIFPNFEEAVKDIDFLVATSSIETKTEKKYLRKTLLIDDFVKSIFKLDGKIGIVFGREDYGLYNHEIAACDIMLRIPTSKSYQALNLSHAVCIVLYSLYSKREYEPRKKTIIDKLEKDKLLHYFSELLYEIKYPDHKKEKTNIMFRRIMGRAFLSKWEYHTLMGVFSRAIQRLKRK